MNPGVCGWNRPPLRGEEEALSGYFVVRRVAWHSIQYHATMVLQHESASVPER